MTLTMGQLEDTFYCPVLKSLHTIDIHTCKTLNGLSYTVFANSAVDAIDIAAPLDIKLVTPATLTMMHLTIATSLAAAGNLLAYEDDGVAAHFDVTGGVAQTPINRNRNSVLTSGVLAYTGVTVTQATADVLILSERIGGVLGGRVERGSYLILKTNTQYLFRLTTDADNNEGSMVLSWFENVS